MHTIYAKYIYIHHQIQQSFSLHPNQDIVKHCFHSLQPLLQYFQTPSIPKNNQNLSIYKRVSIHRYRTLTFTWRNLKQPLNDLAINKTIINSKNMQLFWLHSSVCTCVCVQGIQKKKRRKEGKVRLSTSCHKCNIPAYIAG